MVIACPELSALRADGSGVVCQPVRCASSRAITRFRWDKAEDIQGRQSMLRSLKESVLRSAEEGGLAARLRDSRWRDRRLLILCYHGISLRDEHQWNPMLYLSVDRFRERMAALRDGGYHVLPLREGVRRMYDGTLPPRAVALTFDDGTHDFVARALPILTEFGFPATVYLTTYYCRVQRPVFDVTFGYLLWKAGPVEFDGTGLVREGGPISASNHSERVALMLRAREYASARRLTGEGKDEMLRLLAERIGEDYQPIVRERLLHIMSPDDVATLPRDLVDVQLHTHRHRAPRDQERFRQEIRDNRREIAALVDGGGAAEHFCYPSGYYEPSFLPWLRQENVATATTCVPGIASPDHDPLLLPRLVDTMNVSAVVFNAWLTGAAALLPRRRSQVPRGA